MFRRVTYLLVLTMTVVGGLVVQTAPSASAVPGGSCSIVVPRAIAVVRPLTLVPATLASNCAASGAVFSTWDVRPSTAGLDMFAFDNVSTDSIALNDWERYRTYVVEPSALPVSTDAEGNTLTQNSTSFVVKSGSQLGLAATRVGSYLTLRVGTMYYSPATHTFRLWGGASVVLQYRTCSSCSWTYLKTSTTASNGLASYRFYAPRSRYYRAILTANSSVWGRTTAASVH